MENKFRQKWEAIEHPQTQPRWLRKIIAVGFEEFKNNVLSQDESFVDSLVDSLYAGDGYILKQAFPPEFLTRLIPRTHESGRRSPSSFHKMYQDCPNFHRIIDHETAKKYSFKAIRHSYYFFPWNEDPLNLFKPINERWRIFKCLGGYPLDAYEANKPVDGVIDRLQIAQYPAGIGELEAHSDPYVNQRVIIGGMMSKRGVDYESGGFYFVGENNRKVDIEDELDVGDMVCGYPTVVHGVELVDEHKMVDWTSVEGRWFLGLYSNDSDHVKDKQRGYPVKI
ncbi:hypothetical protein MYX82_00755 [Acidobacteria bacterium AH-259-D05]|nr:hypothetical protein [Acidobacteria bacterium AH-259-D05]